MVDTMREREIEAAVEAAPARKVPNLQELLEKAGTRDKQLAEEVRQLTDLLIDKMAEARANGLIVSIALDNGADSGKPVLTAMRVEKRVLDFVNKSWQQEQQGQRR